MTTTYSDAGVQFADGTIQAVSAALAYRPSNLLGPVSQAAGVPTGAVIQRGSNANGEFVRFADGTQICTHSLPNLVVVAGGTATTVPTWTFPAAFAVPPAASFFGRPDLSPDVFGATYRNADGATGATSVGFVYRNGATAQNIVEIRVTAIGRWF